MVKNSDKVFMAWEFNSLGFGSASNGANLLLEAGDTVSLRLERGTSLYDNYNHHSTFSGHLLFTLTSQNQRLQV